MRRMAAFLALAFGIIWASTLFVSSAEAAGGTFPAQPFNGMQVTYDISGASVTESKDAEGFTVSRTMKGQLGTGTLRVTGTAKQANGYGANVVVTVWSSGAPKEFKTYIKVGNSTTFDVSVPIAPGDTAGGFTIRMTGDYNAGTRGVVVSGSFVSAAQPTAVPTPAPLPCNPEDARQTLVSELSEYFDQFGGTCFAGVISVGDRERYYEALDDVQLAIGNLPNALGQYEGNTLTLSFNPCERRDESTRETLYHELTHKIEVDNWDRWAAQNLFGDVFGYDPFGWKEYVDRNTYYTTQVVKSPLNVLKEIERRAKSGATVDELSPLWDQFVKNMDRGSFGLNSYTNVPEQDELESWTGFRVRVDDIKAFYAGGGCSPTMQRLMQMKYPDEEPVVVPEGDFPTEEWPDDESPTGWGEDEAVG